MSGLITQKLAATKGRIIFQKITIIASVLIHGWMIWLYNIWVSCGCWDNPKLKIWGTIAVYNISFYGLSFGLLKKSSTAIIVIAVISAVIVNAYLLHYVTPIHFLSILNDTALVLIFGIPTILAPFYAGYFLKKAFLKSNSPI